MKGYSNILKILFVSFLTLGIGAVLPAQQPAYFTIGEEELRDDQIYTLHQGKDEIIYVGTNNGLFAYKHGGFERIMDAPEQIRSAVFDLKRDQNNDLFCMNFHGQIFKLIDNQLVLFFQTPSESLGSRFNFYFNEHNDLIIISNHFLTVSNKTKKIKIYNPEKITNVHLSQQVSPNHFIFQSNHVFYEFKNDTLKVLPIAKPKYPLVSSILLDTNIIIFYDDFSKGPLLPYAFNNPVDTEQLSLIKNDRIYQFKNNKNEFFSAANKRGITVYENSNNKIINKGTWFPNQFISTIFRTDNGQLLLGTFGEGIHIIPNRNVLWRNIIPSEEKCQGLCCNNDTIFFTTDANNIYSFHENITLEKVYELKNANIFEKIFYAEGFNYFNNIGTTNLIYDNITNAKGSTYSSVKDVWQLPNKNILIAHRNGLEMYGNTKMDNVFWENITSSAFHHFIPFKGRTEAVCYSPDTKTIYAFHKGQLIAIDSNYKQSPILYQNQNINSWDLSYHNKTLYIATQKHGILVLKNDTIYSKYNEKNGLIKNNVDKIKIVDNQLFLSYINGLQIINLENDEITNLGTAEGISKGRISDFDVGENQIWVLWNNEILSIDRDKLPQSNDSIVLYLDSITVNDEKINLYPKTTFNYQQKKFDFHLDFRTVILQNEISIFYKLEGSDINWTETDVKDYIISYKALSHGNYTFRAYAKFRDKKSQEIIYSFKITPPIWQRWWFYLLLILLISAIFYLFYNTRMKQLNQLNQAALDQEKAEREKQVAEKEMIESELKALRSQMNPHFIFNSLNSIQDLILREETDKSYDYIVLFADLVRSTLNHSNKQFISIKKELDFLNVYLSLEKLRFKENFNYTIHHSDIEGIEIPSLLIQPFIENALLHGLLHKKGKKELNIRFEIIEEILLCTVTDNGVGRERALQIRKRQKRQHESFSMEAIKKRLSFLSGQHSVDAKYEFVDLIEEGKNTGTKVIIQMPYKHVF